METGHSLSKINRDGNSDVIKLDKVFYGLSVLLNDGSSHHYPRLRQYSTLEDPSSLTDGDMNSDGYPDVIVGRGPKGGLSINYNDGHGRFRNQMFQENVCTSSSVQAADLNGDRSVDIIVICSADNRFMILFNDGNGGFIMTSILLAQLNTKSVAIGDLDATNTSIW